MGEIGSYLSMMSKQMSQLLVSNDLHVIHGARFFCLHTQLYVLRIEAMTLLCI